ACLRITAPRRPDPYLGKVEGGLGVRDPPVRHCVGTPIDERPGQDALVRVVVENYEMLVGGAEIVAIIDHVRSISHRRLMCKPIAYEHGDRAVPHPSQLRTAPVDDIPVRTNR